jgi:hypothetical protein
MEVKEVFEKIKESGQSIKRFEYCPYSMPTALKMFHRIGQILYGDNFVVDNDNVEVYKNLIRWVHGCTEKPTEHFIVQDPKSREKIPGSFTKGIYLAGPTGVGKTAAIEVMKRYAKIDGVHLLINGDLVAVYPKDYRTDEICEHYRKTGDVQEFKSRRFIVFHDIASDSEQEESIYMGNRLKVMQNIIESRGDRLDLLTFFTSNIPFINPAFSERYGDRVVSRIFQMCNYIEMKGKDRRKL